MPKPQPAIVHTLNARFRDGKASNELAHAGLLLRQFDDTEDQSQPWRGCPAHVVTAGSGRECQIYGNRFSASIISAELFVKQQKIRIFSNGAGVIYSPHVKLNCIYGGDGGTRSKSEDGCGSQFCEPSRSRTDGWCDGQPHVIEAMAGVLANMQPGNYNEAIINTKSIDDHLPKAVEAIFYIKNQASQHSRDVHANFLKEYHLDAAEHPLLRLDPANLERPLQADGT